MADLTDEQLAAFATPQWVDSVAAVPLDEMAVMVAEDPSVMTALIGALRHARGECHGRRFDPNLVAENRELRAALVRARGAAQVYAERVDALGLAADDNDPKVMVTAGPIGEAQADLYATLGLLQRDESGKVGVVPPAETVEQLRAERDTTRMLAEVRGVEIDGLRAALEHAKTALYDAMHAGHLSRAYHDSVIVHVESALRGER